MQPPDQLAQAPPQVIQRVCGARAAGAAPPGGRASFPSHGHINLPVSLLPPAVCMRLMFGNVDGAP
jgi:hypothetical protein